MTTESWFSTSPWVVLSAMLLCSASSSARAEDRPLSPAENRLKSDVSFLADDAREGRSPGSAGIEAAATYIADTFKKAGLKTAPGADGYFQPFQIAGVPKLGGETALSATGPDGKSIKTSDFSPLAIGTGADFKDLPVVFAGYGITAKDDAKKLDYDDYAGIDVKGKVVLLIRREPQQNDDKSPFDGKRMTDFATFRHKATNAYQHGAAAVLLANDSKEAKEDARIGFTASGFEKSSDLPFMMVSRKFADQLLNDAGPQSLESLETQIDGDLKPRSMELKNWTISSKYEISRKPIDTRNVIGILEGEGPLANETIVIGAHYDHLGHGGRMSGSLDESTSDIHNGADDNASGTTMMMEMARRLARRGDPLPRRVVFAAFSGEEKGLLGSQHYVDHPLFPLKNTVVMINFDMVGRLNEKNELTVYGTGTSPGFDTLVDTLGKSEGFTIKKISDGLGPSDQQSFYLKDIPVLFAFTGTHTDYHKPSDDSNLINVGGMSRIADLAEVVLLDLTRRPSRPAFVKVASDNPHGGVDVARVSITAYLGSIPDYNEDIKGVKLNGVREGSPAQKGGLQKDDVIIKFGGKPIGTIYDYTENLGRYKPGDEVEVVVTRGGKEVALKVVLGTKPSGN